MVSGLSAADLYPVADTVNPNKFYAYNNGSMMVSTNGGVSFTNGGTLASGGSKIVRAVPGIEGNVWVALYGGGLARSTNSGASYSNISNVSYCGAVGFGKAAPGATHPTIYIWGTVGGVLGAHRSTDIGATWARVNDDAHEYGGPANGQFVLGDMNTFGVVYMSTAGRGIAYGTPTGAIPDPAGTTRIASRSSGKCAEVNGSSNAAGATVVQNPCGTGDSQKWTFEPLTGGYFRVKASHSGLCMDLASQSTADLIGVVQGIAELAVANSGSKKIWAAATIDCGRGSATSALMYLVTARRTMSH